VTALDDSEAAHPAPAPPVGTGTGDAERASRGVQLGDGTAQSRARLASPLARAGLTVTSSLAGVIALGVLFDAISTRFVPGNSDGATVVLEGAAMNAGNLTLRGWAISLDSFWTLDALVYALAVRVEGLRPGLMNLVPAIIAAAVVVLGALLARAGRRGLPGFVAAATVVTLLGLPSPDLAYFLLQGPWHVGTTLAALGAFALLARPGLGWRWLAGVALLAAGLLGDVMIVTFGLLPLLACGLVTMARCRRWRAGLATLAAAPASAALALLVRVLAQAAGTFTIVNRNLPIRFHQLAENVGNLGNRLPGLLGVGTIPQTVPDGAIAFQAARVAGLAAVLAAGATALVGLARGAVLGRAPGGAAGPWRLDDLLVAGIAADLVTFVWAAGSNNTDYAKYLTPAVILGAVLCGRYAGRWAAQWAGGRARLPAALTPLGGRRDAPDGRHRLLVALTASAAIVAAALFAAEVGVELSAPDAVQPARQLSAFLAAHHLDHGVGDYWSSTVVTLDSSGTVQVRPVTPAPNGTLRRYERQSPESWYAGQRFDFLVFDTARPWRGVDAAAAERTWGPPAREDAVGTYRVLVWSKPFTVSTEVPDYGSPLQIFWSPSQPPVRAR
jgi:hypothetical protein